MSPDYNKTIQTVLFRTAAKYPDAIAIDYMNTKISYKKLRSEVEKCAAAMEKIGIKPGDRVTICLPNIPQSVIAFYATLAVGATANMIHPLSAGPEIEFAVNVANSNCLFVLDGFFDKTSGINCPTLKNIIYSSAGDYLAPLTKAGFWLTQGRKIPKITNKEGVISWTAFMKNAGPAAPKAAAPTAGAAAPTAAANPDPKSEAVILYSGGTSGKQKGIQLSHYNINALSALTIQHGCPTLGKGDKMLAVLPMFHGFGLGVCIHSSIYAGATIVLVPRFNADICAGLIKKKKPAVIVGVPTLYEALLRNNRMKNVDCSCLKGAFAGGDSLPYEIKMAFDECLRQNNSPVLLREGYGLTECVTASALTPNDDYRKSSVGLPYTGITYKIISTENDNGPYTPLEPMTDGEIALKGPTVMLGYLNEPEETSKVLRVHEDGDVWLHTGDLGYMDKDGFIYFKSRIKRMIKCKGYSVYPSQIEAVINAHPKVSMSCVIGVEDSYEMNKLKAFIVLKEGVDRTDPEALRKEFFTYFGENIARFSQPKIIEFKDSLPMTKVGKIAYTQLK